MLYDNCTAFAPLSSAAILAPRAPFSSEARWVEHRAEGQRDESMAPKKRQFSYKESYAKEFGVRVTSLNSKTGAVEAVVCRFCESFGREALEGEPGARKRQKTTNSKHYKGNFRSDNMRNHLQQQHPMQWKRYKDVLLNETSEPEAVRTFFSQTRVEAFFEKRSQLVGNKRIFSLNKEIVEGIIKRLFVDSENELAGDRQMGSFQPMFEGNEDGMDRVISMYTVSIPNPTQFNYVVSLLAAGLSFEQVAKVVKENRDQLGTAMKTGSISPGEVSEFSRIVCAVGLQIIADVMAGSWAFALASDVSSDNFGNSHLDVRVQFPPVTHGTDVLSFHLLAIPLFEESHSGESLFSIISDVLDALCGNWKEKMIGSTTDGAPNMTGCHTGFSKRLVEAVAPFSLAFYRVWCLAHQLDLVIKDAMNAIGDRGGLDFMGTMTKMVGWLRRQQILIRQMRSKCPYYINVRWTSCSKVDIP